MRLWRGLLALASVATASVIPTEKDLSIEERDSACTNGPLTRACWNNGYSIATDFDQKHPNTGVTVKYDLTITNGTCNPDGHERLCFLINGIYPGPVLTGNWGDYMEVTVRNEMQDNGTSIHFHGVRQLNSCGSDGVGGLTECPIAPGTSGFYRFQITQYGTSWYHSHFSSQYGDGVVGPLVFNGPASANYDVDLGPYPINDWYYSTAFQINALTGSNLQNEAPPPNAENVLINGTNQNAQGGGRYNYVTITKGKKYRIRLINMSVDNYIRVSLDGHPFQVMTSDFIPINPFFTNWILLGIGQRYDVVVNANQTDGNFWFRAQTANDCLSGNNFYGRAVWTYDTTEVAAPTSTAAPFAADCTEPLPVPFWRQPVPSSSFNGLEGDLNLGLTGAQVVPGGGFVTVWALNSSSMNVAWDDPTLKYVMDGNTSYPTPLNVIPTVAEGSWNYWLIQQANGIPPIPHPVHLHGHDFFVLGQGKSTFNASTAVLNWNTAPRRDTATVYGNGWLALAFNSNNPGAWLMHCHIAWHISEGLGVQFLESPGSMTLPSAAEFQQQCASWDSYQKTMPYGKIDSGL